MTQKSVGNPNTELGINTGQELSSYTFEDLRRGRICLYRVDQLNHQPMNVQVPLYFTVQEVSLRGKILQGILVLPLCRLEIGDFLISWTQIICFFGLLTGSPENIICYVLFVLSFLSRNFPVGLCQCPWHCCSASPCRSQAAWLYDCWGFLLAAKVRYLDTNWYFFCFWDYSRWVYPNILNESFSNGSSGATK